jgi:hypothetical protein
MLPAGAGICRQHWHEVIVALRIRDTISFVAAAS